MIIAGGLPDLAELRSGLAEALDVDVAALDVQERRVVSEGTVPKEIVTLRAHDNVRRLFCKHGAAAEPSADAPGGTRFELKVYRTVLAAAPDPAPLLVGAYERREGGTTLVLAAADGAVRLSEAPVERMQAAARWLGSFHRWSAGLELETLGLPTTSQWRGDAGRTLQFARDAGLTIPWLEDLCSRIIEAADDLLPGERCVVHGEFTVHNVLVRGEQILPTDWEGASVGPGELDLAMLVERWPLDVRHACERAYCTSRWPEGAPADQRSRFALARVLVALHWLGFRPGWIVREDKAWRLDGLRELAREAGLV